MQRDRQLEILSSICDLPTAPYCEEHVIRWLLAWANGHKPAITTRLDKAGNLYLEYRRGRRRAHPLIIEAHMDHPGFIVTGRRRDGRIEAHFRGGVKPSHFKNAGAKFWISSKSRWVKAKVQQVKPVPKQRHLRVILRGNKAPPVGSIGMWDLPDARVKGHIFAARVCDDLAGIAAIVCLLDRLAASKIDAHVIGLCSRAEEVGFAGVLAVCENGWMPRSSPVIGLETSKASANAPQGSGPVIRVGDRTGIFSAGLTHFLAQTAAGIADDDTLFIFQRKLMDGGMCNSTAFAAYGYDSAAMCVALGNYHNMTNKGEPGWKTSAGGKAGPGIASETIDLRDFRSLVRILVEVAKKIGHYQPGLAPIKSRLSAMHQKEQRRMLRETLSRFP